MQPEPGLSPQPGRFEDLLALELDSMDSEVARASLTVRDDLCDGGGALHGGVFAALAQDLVSRASAGALAAEGRTALGLSNQTRFIRALREGGVHAVARRRHGGRSTWVWEVEMTDDRGELCAFSRVTVAVAD